MFEVGDVVRLRLSNGGLSRIYYKKPIPDIQIPAGAVATVTSLRDGDGLIDVAFWAHNLGVTAHGFDPSKFELVRRAQPCPEDLK